MLVVRVELWPGGRPDHPTTIAVAGIANVSGLAPVSSYLTVVVDDSGDTHSALVADHRRADGPWPLVARAVSPRASRRVPAPLEPTVQLILERLQAVPEVTGWVGTTKTAGG